MSKWARSFAASFGGSGFTPIWVISVQSGLKCIKSASWWFQACAIFTLYLSKRPSLMCICFRGGNGPPLRKWLLLNTNAKRVCNMDLTNMTEGGLLLHIVRRMYEASWKNRARVTWNTTENLVGEKICCYFFSGYLVHGTHVNLPYLYKGIVQQLCRWCWT